MRSVTDRLSAMQRLGRAIGDPTRSRILLRLVDGAAYPAGLAEELGLTRQNVSNHLACLRDCGIVTPEPEGRQVRYRLADPHLGPALTALLAVPLVGDGAPCGDPGCPLPECRPKGYAR